MPRSPGFSTRVISPRYLVGEVSVRRKILDIVSLLFSVFVSCLTINNAASPQQSYSMGTSYHEKLNYIDLELLKVNAAPKAKQLMLKHSLCHRLIPPFSLKNFY